MMRSRWKRRFCSWSTLLVLLLALPASGQETPEWSALEELAATVVDGGEVPGVAIAWARVGGEPRVGVAGVRAVDGGEAVGPTDLFHIGSITKSVTATAVGALVEEGALSWDATLGALMPGVEMHEVFAAAELGDLLRHRARIPQHLTMDDAEMSRLNGLPGSSTEQRALYVAEVLALEPLEPGYHYSNAGYALVAAIAERASGKSWEQMVREEVFDPLGLDSCGIGWPATLERPDQPRGHFPSDEGLRVQGPEEYPLGAFIEPAGDIHCSIGDLVRYGLAHLAGLTGRDGLLKAATIQELHRVPSEGAPYAAGWGVDPESGQHRHSGSAGTFFAYLTIDPEAQMVVAFAANVGPAGAQAVARRVAGAILERHARR